MSIRKNVTLIFMVVFSYLAFAIFQSKTIDVCDIYCGDNLGQFHNILLFFPFLLFFSLATYKLPERVFTSWWRFARIGAPLVLILSFLINLELHHSPAGEFQNMFDALALWLLYILFSVGSIISIFVGWRKGNQFLCEKVFSHKYKLVNLFLFLTLGIILYYMSINYENWFKGEDLYDYYYPIYQPLYSGGKYLLVVLGLLLIIPSHIFRRWLLYVAPLPTVLIIFLVQSISIYSSGIMQASRGKMAENGMFILGFITIVFIVSHLIYDRKKVISK